MSWSRKSEYGWNVRDPTADGSATLFGVVKLDT
jgi:hypothetical protein